MNYTNESWNNSIRFPRMNKLKASSQLETNLLDRHVPFPIPEAGSPLSSSLLVFHEKKRNRRRMQRRYREVVGGQGNEETRFYGGIGGRGGGGHKKTRRPLPGHDGIGCVLPKAGKRRDGARMSGANGSPSFCQFQLTSIPRIRSENRNLRAFLHPSVQFSLVRTIFQKLFQHSIYSSRLVFLLIVELINDASTR